MGLVIKDSKALNLCINFVPNPQFAIKRTCKEIIN